MVLVALPIFVVLMLMISRHYKTMREDIVISSEEEKKILLSTPPTVKIIMPVSDLNRAFIKALNYALSIKDAEIELYHVASSEEDTEAYRRRFEALRLPVNLLIDVTEYRNNVELLLDHVKSEQNKLQPHQMLTVIMSQIVVKHWWQRFLHNRGSEMIRKNWRTSGTFP